MKNLLGLFKYAWAFVHGELQRFCRRSDYGTGCAFLLAVALMPVVVPLMLVMLIRHQFTRIGRIQRAPSAAGRYPALIVETDTIVEPYVPPRIGVIRAWLSSHGDLSRVDTMKPDRVLRLWERRAKENLMVRTPREDTYTLALRAKHNPPHTPFEATREQDGCFVVSTSRSRHVMSYLLPEEMLLTRTPHEDYADGFAMGYTSLWLVRHHHTIPAPLRPIMRLPRHTDTSELYRKPGNFLVFRDPQFNTAGGASGLIEVCTSIEEASEIGSEFTEKYAVSTCVGELVSTISWH